MGSIGHRWSVTPRLHRFARGMYPPASGPGPRRRGNVHDVAEFLDRSAVTWHGVKAGRTGLGRLLASLSFTVTGVGGKRFYHFILNAYWEPLEFELPVMDGASRGWLRLVDTYLEPPEDITTYEAAARLRGRLTDGGDRSWLRCAVRRVLAAASSLAPLEVARFLAARTLRCDFSATPEVCDEVIPPAAPRHPDADLRVPRSQDRAPMWAIRAFVERHQEGLLWRLCIRPVFGGVPRRVPSRARRSRSRAPSEPCGCRGCGVRNLRRAPARPAPAHPTSTNVGKPRSVRAAFITSIIAISSGVTPGTAGATCSGWGVSALGGCASSGCRGLGWGGICVWSDDFRLRRRRGWGGRRCGSWGREAGTTMT